MLSVMSFEKSRGDSRGAVADFGSMDRVVANHASHCPLETVTKQDSGPVAPNTLFMVLPHIVMV
jgi:hypothetical protein